MKRSPAFRLLPLLYPAVFAGVVLAAAPRPQVIAMYESLAGDFADIRLVVHADHTFALEMTLLEDQEHIVMSGDWTQESGTHYLRFTHNKPFIGALFNQNMIVDDQTFRLDLNQPELWIWGTRCQRKDTVHPLVMQQSR